MRCQNSLFPLGVVQASRTCPSTALPLLESSSSSAFSCPCSGQTAPSSNLSPSASYHQHAHASTHFCVSARDVSHDLCKRLAHLVMHRQCIERHVCCVACALNSIQAKGHSPSGQCCHRCISSCCTPFDETSKEYAVCTLIYRVCQTV